MADSVWHVRVLVLVRVRVCLCACVRVRVGGVCVRVCACVWACVRVRGMCMLYLELTDDMLNSSHANLLGAVHPFQAALS